jgi:hypothetical protein
LAQWIGIFGGWTVAFFAVLVNGILTFRRYFSLPLGKVGLASWGVIGTLFFYVRGVRPP